MHKKPVHSEDNDDVNRVIGRAVSVPIASGKSLNKAGIQALLRDSEQHSVDGASKVYADAIRKVTREMD